MSLPRYPKYKDSGVEWLGEVPEHWKVVRYKQVFKEREERSLDGLELLLSVSAYTGVSPRSEIVDDGEHLSRAETLEGYKVCYPDDLVMNIMLAWNRGLAFSPLHGIVSPAYCVFHLIDDSSPRFMDYMVRADRTILYYKAYSSGVIDSRLRLYPDTFASLYCLLPPRQEQREIAAFLDREMAKIDVLVEEQRRLIELLKEKRQAVISHAVTKGLNPKVPLKDSGIEWLGKVPKHWEVSALKRFWTITDCKHITAEFVEEGIPLASIREVQSRFVSLDDAKRTTSECYEQLIEGGRKPISGDLIFSRNATVGEVAQVSTEHPVFAMGQDVCLLRRSADTYSSDYLQYVIRSKVVVEQLQNLMIGSTFKRINVEEICGLIIPMPPSIEQFEIAAYIDRVADQFELLSAEATRAIGLLQERRTALISAAVTGKIDVREQVAKPVAAQKSYETGFARQLLAAEILNRYYAQPTMGRVKLQKLIHLCEHVAEIEEIHGEYQRKAAGPFDNTAMFGIAGGLSRQKWFSQAKEGGRTVYRPLEKAGDHQKYLARWANKMPAINKVLQLLGTAGTEQCEIVSTLYAAWNDLLIEGKSPTDAEIIYEASDASRWHANKAKIALERWQKALGWMREKELVPRGYGRHTKRVDAPPATKSKPTKARKR